MSFLLKSSCGVVRLPGFCVRSIDGVRMKGNSGSVETGTRGRALMMAVTSDMNVTKTS